MPVSVQRLRSTGATILTGRCEVEGCREHAPFGVEGYIMQAFKALEAGEKDRAKLLLGKRFCEQHLPTKAVPKQSD